MNDSFRVFLVIAVGAIMASLQACRSTPISESHAVAVEAAITHPELRSQLMDLFNRDQRARKDMLRAIRGAPTRPDGTTIYPESAMPLVHAVQAIDQESADFLHSMITSMGWPTFDMVGRDGAESAWLLAQHADADPEMQRQALALMEPLVHAGQASPANFAYLTDRVLVAERQPQVYGTQFTADRDGIQRPYPMIDPANINKRRLTVGLPPMAFAAKQMQKAVGGQVEIEPLTSFPTSSH